MICLFDGFVYLLFVSGLIVCLVVSYLFVDLFVCCFVLLCWFLICLIRLVWWAIAGSGCVSFTFGVIWNFCGWFVVDSGVVCLLGVCC